VAFSQQLQPTNPTNQSKFKIQSKKQTSAKNSIGKATTTKEKTSIINPSQRELQWHLADGHESVYAGLYRLKTLLR